MVIKLLKVLFLTIFIAGIAVADERQDYLTQSLQGRYFDLQQNAQSFGMAGSSALLARDSSTIVGNPAGLGLMSGGDLSVTYGRNNVEGEGLGAGGSDLEYEEDLGQTLLALPLGPTTDGLPQFGNLGIGWTGYDGEVDNDSTNPEVEGYRLALAYGKALSETFSVGYSLTYVNDEVNGDGYSSEMDNGFRHTVGILNQVTDVFSYGLSAFVGHGDRDITVGGESTDSDLLQTGVALSTGFDLGTGTLVAFGANYSHYDADADPEVGGATSIFGGDEDGDSFGVSAGIQQAITNYLALRAGYRYAGNDKFSVKKNGTEYLGKSAKYNAWTAGLGISIPTCNRYFSAINVDYGVEYRADDIDDWQHVVTTSFPLGFCRNA